MATATKTEIANVTPAPPAEYFSPHQLDLIKRQICPGATNDELDMFIADCKRSRLDPFARQIYSIGRRERFNDNGQWKWRTKRTTQVSIDGFRLIAERTGEYAGQLGPEWCGEDGVWRDVWLSKDPPSAARVGVMRKDFEKPLWTPALFTEYAVRNEDDKPTGLWAKMPALMIAKCAEALGLRRAFPRDLSDFYTAEEMMQAGPPVDVTPTDDPNIVAIDDEPPFGEEPKPAPKPKKADRITSGPALAQAVAVEQATTEAAAQGLSLEDMAREAAKHGHKQLALFYNGRSAADKAKLRAIEAELIKLYPKQKEAEQ